MRIHSTSYNIFSGKYRYAVYMQVPAGCSELPVTEEALFIVQRWALPSAKDQHPPGCKYARLGWQPLDSHDQYHYMTWKEVMRMITADSNPQDRPAPSTPTPVEILQKDLAALRADFNEFKEIARLFFAARS